jgi:predicted nuclease of predicted toxin-antitoxin system
MKLLFDHNLPPSLVVRLWDLFPDSQHVYSLGLDRVLDLKIRDYARSNGFLIVTKDVDFSNWGAWAFRFLVSTLTLKVFYARQVKKWIPHFVKTIRAEGKPSAGESEIMTEATMMSQRMVQMAMRNEST